MGKGTVDGHWTNEGELNIRIKDLRDIIYLHITDSNRNNILLTQIVTLSKRIHITSFNIEIRTFFVLKCGRVGTYN